VSARSCDRLARWLGQESPVDASREGNQALHVSSVGVQRVIDLLDLTLFALEMVVSSGMRTFSFYVQEGMPAFDLNRNVITKRTAVGPTQYQPECVSFVFYVQDGMPAFLFQIQPSINQNAYNIFLLTGRNSREISKSPGGLGWPQPSITRNAYNLF